MQITLRKIGNSTGLILPKGILEILKLKNGDSIDIETKDEVILIKKNKPHYSLE